MPRGFNAPGDFPYTISVGLLYYSSQVHTLDGCKSHSQHVQCFLVKNTNKEIRKEIRCIVLIGRSLTIDLHRITDLRLVHI